MTAFQQRVSCVSSRPVSRWLFLWGVLYVCFSVSACSSATPQQAQPVLSDASLRALQRANTYGASLFHVSPPGPAFIVQMRRALPRDYPAMDEGIRLALANIERDQPYLDRYFAQARPQQLASFVQTYKAKIVASSDPVEQQVRLAEVMAFSALTAYRKRQGNATVANSLQRQQMETLKSKQLQGAMRSYSPTCNPTRPDAASNFQSCHP